MAGAAVSDFYTGEHCRLQQGKHMQAGCYKLQSPLNKNNGPKAKHEARKI